VVAAAGVLEAQAEDAGRRSAGLNFGLEILGRGRYPGIVRRQSKQPGRPRFPRAAAPRISGSCVGGLLDFEELAEGRSRDQTPAADFDRPDPASADVLENRRAGKSRNF